jgi:hypothetical protein
MKKIILLLVAACSALFGCAFYDGPHRGDRGYDRGGGYNADRDRGRSDDERGAEGQRGR